MGPEEPATPIEPTAVLVADTDLMFRAVLDTIEGLTAKEFLWEPVTGCWSIRSSLDGGHVQDWMPAPALPPFTTIAWRMAHIGQSLAAHAHRLFQRGSFSYDTYRPAGSIHGERAFLSESFSLWRDGIAGCGDSLTPSLAQEVLSLNHHHLGHAKEIDAIRQLFRASRPLNDDPLVDACLRGETALVASMLQETDQREGAEAKTPHLVLAAASMGWWPIVTMLLQHGWPPDTARGTTALHHAAAAGDRAMVKLLLDHGADPTRRDPEWNATPRGWAEYFQNAKTIDSLP